MRRVHQDRFGAATKVFEYASGTVSYAKELTSVSVCYSQGDGFNILSRLFYILQSVAVIFLLFKEKSERA